MTVPQSNTDSHLPPMRPLNMTESVWVPRVRAVAMPGYGLVALVAVLAAAVWRYHQEIVAAVQTAMM